MSAVAMPTRIRVLVADDHPIVRKGLAQVIHLQEDMEVVAEADNGQDAFEKYMAHRPDVTLMDLRMPEMDGVEAIQRIRAEAPDARVVVLTTYDGDEDIYRGLRAGAMGYLLKDAALEELLRGIRIVHANQSFFPPAVAAKLAKRIRRVELTDRETEVLREMAHGKTNKQIATALHISESTVKVHVNNVLGKLDVASRTEAVTLALKRGIVRLE